MPGYGGPNGPDGSKKSGDQGGSQGGGNHGAGTGGLSGGGKSWGRQISDLFGGPAAYATNPNRPNYDTRTMGVPISTYGMTPTGLLGGQNLGMSPEMSMAMSALGQFAGPINGAMGLTRGIQAATGMSGGPAIGGRDDGLGAFGGHGGTANGGLSGGGMSQSQGYQLPQGYMQNTQIPQTTLPPTVPQQTMINQPGQYLSPTPGYGVDVPAYSYFGPMRPQTRPPGLHSTGFR